MRLINIAEVWISAELWSANEWDADDSIVDVIVTLDDGSRWTATVCSYRHVQTLVSKWSESGECLNGRYLWAKSLILTTDTSRDTIQVAMKDLIENGEFEHALEESDAG
jgi:hypothetical protein